MISNGIHPLVFPIFLSALISGAIGLFASRQTNPGSKLFALMMLAMAHYATTYGLELLSSNLETMLLWVKLEYLGVAGLPVLLFLFALVYTGQGNWVTMRNIVLLSVVPALIVLLVWTNSWHHFIYTSAQVVEVNGIRLLQAGRGFAYWINIAYGYFLVVAAVFLFARYFLTTTSFYQWQIAFILLGIAVSWVGDILYVFLLRGQGGLDLAPVMFAVSGMVMAVGLFRYRLLDLMPVARSKLVETMQNAWIVLDAQNRLVDLNPAALTILGQPKRQLIGSKIEDVLPGDRSLLAGLGIFTEIQTELNLFTGGVPRSYDVKISLLKDSQQQPNGRLLVFHDITEWKKNEDALRALNSSLETAVQQRTAEIRAEKEKVEKILHNVENARNQFIASISHELRTPITNLKLYLSLLEYTPLTEKGQEYSAVLRQQADRLEGLAAGVVELARLDSLDGGKPDIRPFQIETVLKSALDNLETAVAERQLRVVVSTPAAALPPVAGDVRLAQQAVNEVMKNAIYFSPDEGEIRLLVELREPAWIVFAITDDGPGIAPTEQEKIFERFYRGTAVTQGTTPGFGLGLSLAWKIMQIHGGRIALESQLNRGSTFSLWFPVHQNDMVN